MYTTIAGFPEYSPAEQIAFNKMCEQIKLAYELVGAVPLETPAVERISTLQGKASDDKEIYALRRLAASQGEETDVALALRFDLTVPLARYAGSHENDLTFPYKRYQIQPVWRGERSQKGRYRQFVQCDIDVIGDGELSLMHDAEMPFIIYQIFKSLNIGDFVVSVNNRKILTGFLSQLGVGEAQISKVIKIIDSKDKVGLTSVNAQLKELKIDESAAQKIVEFFTISGNDDEILLALKGFEYGGEFQDGVNELDSVVKYMKLLGMPGENFKIDLGIARGLDYYTGTVYETRLISQMGVGSICSGGRYDHLLQKLGAPKEMPGVGISIGLSRLFVTLVELGLVDLPAPSTAKVFVTTMDHKYIADYLNMATSLRKANINTEIFYEKARLSKQMKYANKKGIELVIIAGENELSEGNVTIRRLSTGEQKTLSKDDLIKSIQEML